MSRDISENLREAVENRAEGLCEYCRIAIEDTYFGGEIDHIINLKHRGATTLENLALACLNRAIAPKEAIWFRLPKRQVR